MSENINTITNTKPTNFFDLFKPEFKTDDRFEIKTQFKFQNIFSKIDFEQQAKNSYGNLHPQYKQSIQKGFQTIKDYIELYSNDILNTVREIDLLCIKSAQRKMQNYEKCKQETNLIIHKQITIPLVNASGLLHKLSNQCLLKGNSIGICSSMVSDHAYFAFKLAAEKIKAMTFPMAANLPEEFRASSAKALPINNQIIDAQKK